MKKIIILLTLLDMFPYKAVQFFSSFVGKLSNFLTQYPHIWFKNCLIYTKNRKKVNGLLAILYMVTCLMTLSSCKWFTEATPGGELAFANIRIPAGSPNFQKGYKDGCATVLYSRGNGFYRSKYKYSFHGDLIDDDEYIFGRKRGYNFCFGYITGASGQFAKGWDGYIYAQGTPFDMGRGNIDDTVIGRASGSFGGKANSVWDTFGDTRGGVGGSVGVLTRNRANTGGVFGGHMFYGQTAEQQNQILGF